MNSSASRLGLTDALRRDAFPSLNEADTVSGVIVAEAPASHAAGLSLPPLSPEPNSGNPAATISSPENSAISDLSAYPLSHIKHLTPPKTETECMDYGAQDAVRFSFSL
nr:hypothetical protein Iba_chr07bCG15750 [Ipomoea batatas]